MAIRCVKRGNCCELTFDPKKLRGKEFASALAIVQAHRAAHYQPMLTANVALRGYCQRRGIKGEVTQRLKRMDTILDKLKREPKISLDRMQDFGGCRVVFDDLSALCGVQKRLLKRHKDAKVYDYVTQKRSSGYRAVHIVTTWGGDVRKIIEIQLRTRAMHQWADMVERASLSIGINYKQAGNADFQQWAKSLSDIMECREQGRLVPDDVTKAYRRSWKKIAADVDRGEM